MDCDKSKPLFQSSMITAYHTRFMAFVHTRKVNVKCSSGWYHVMSQSHTITKAEKSWIFAANNVSGFIYEAHLVPKKL